VQSDYVLCILFIFNCMYRFYISYTKCTNSTKSDFQKCININHSYIKKYFSKKIVYIILKKISVILSINVTWRDRRLTFLNLRYDIFDNVLPDDSRDSIWVPDIGTIIITTQTNGLLWKRNRMLKTRVATQLYEISCNLWP